MTTHLTNRLPALLENLDPILAQICRQPDRFLILVDTSSKDRIIWSSLEAASPKSSKITTLEEHLCLDTPRERTVFEGAVKLAQQTGRSSYTLPANGPGLDTTEWIFERVNLLTLAASQVLLLACPRGVKDMDRAVDYTDSLLFALQQAGEGFGITDTEGNFTFLNRAHVEMFGYETAKDLIGKSWRVLYDEAEVARLEREVMPALDNRGEWSGMAKGKRVDGTFFEESLTLTKTSDGRVICNCRNRTSEMAALRKLKRQEEFFRKVAENLPSGVLIRRREGPYLFANRAANEFLDQLNIRGVVGKTVEDIVPDDIRKQLLKISDHELEESGEHKLVRNHVVCEHPSGKRTIDVVKFLTPDLENHQQEAICIICTDVTERRQIESQLREALDQKSRALSMQREFVSMISHEFRSPMTAIQATSHLIELSLDGSLPGKVARYLEIQKESLDTLGDLVDRVLLLNKLETAVTEPNLDATNLPEFIRSIVDFFNESAASARIHLILPDEELGLLPVDTALLKAAVENLVCNAIKYSDPPKPVYVRLSRNSEHLEISVEDFGRGIPDEDQQCLFTTFFRAGNVGSIPGTGLGLRIVQRSVEFHNGSVGFRSKEGEGSTFTIKIPLTTQ